MERDSLSVGLDNVEWVDADQQPEQPCLIIDFNGPEEDLKHRFRKPDSSRYTPEDLDLFYRLQSSDHPAASGGVFSVSDSVTGDYLFEINVPPDLIEKFVYVMRQYTATAEETRYEVELRVENHQVAVFEKEVFLVYGSDRTLLRHRSLIPDEIEI